ncbi:hypothetical protein VTP01DRAFT_8444 [Rhizomucor pusillus]|uniref:uncharacterized protein n=1 Tax=Rhizomucor pusillus TaxID=4840 RepID=UPI003742328E
MFQPQPSVDVATLLDDHRTSFSSQQCGACDNVVMHGQGKDSTNAQPAESWQRSFGRTSHSRASVRYHGIDLLSVTILRK